MYEIKHAGNMSIIQPLQRYQTNYVNIYTSRSTIRPNSVRIRPLSRQLFLFSIAIDEIRTHTIVTLQHKSLSPMLCAIDNSATSDIYI